MDFKQLEAFVQISKLQSFSKASEALFLTQPTLSNQINILEKEIGTQLLVRSTKKIYPTKAGVKFYEHAQNMLALRDQSLFEMGKFTKECAGEINILASSVPAQYLLPQLISDFNKEYTNIVFRLYQRDSGVVFEELSQYQYDIGFVGTETESSRYKLTAFCKDQLVLVLPKSMRYTGCRNASDIVSFISNKNFIMRELGSGTRAKMQLFLNQNKMYEKDMKIVAYFSSTQGIVEAVSKGLGISFVSKAAASIYKRLNLVNMVEIESEELSRDIFYVLKKDMILTPAQELFINYAKNYYKR
ncbi:selenium metabolism-associated LysR family transcriptional regulator [Lacrimispora algidixylanolytica]|uniref:HTH lysR-type domain-containing protein n=1 Tax=Lacrimispora algidixylanolytica TaxID=94868 RepID=A0A419SVP3_9FIRM|nr:selenium metabolism-associated LysR family transcriptional regulator [Lacrimispora algidixylanolytica]RKD29294.1 hypothetical protein BET01_08030 [Lacrimispora algidixylanolytica]